MTPIVYNSNKQNNKLLTLACVLENSSPRCKDLNCMPFVYTICPLQKCKPDLLTAFTNLTALLFDFLINTIDVYCMAPTKAKSYWIQRRDYKEKNNLLAQNFENVMKHYCLLEQNSKTLVVCLPFVCFLWYTLWDIHMSCL